MLWPSEQAIPCPVCKTPIPFDARQLLQGARFACPNCSAAINLASESKDTVAQALTAFEQARAKIGHGG